MNDILNSYLNIVPKSLRDAISELENQHSRLNRSGNIPTQDIYQELLYTTQRIAAAASNMTEVLKEIAENTDLPEPGPIAGAARKVNLGFTHTEKAEVAQQVLASANQILGSHDRLVPPIVAEVAALFYDFPKEE